MKKWLSKSVLLLLMICFWTGQATAGFDIRGQRTFDLDAAPVDITVSGDGKWTFVLTEEGEIRVVNPAGELFQTIEEGKGFNRIEFSALGNRLILSSTRDKTMKVISLELIHSFDTTAAPTKGPRDAAVTVAVFNDFQ